MKRAAIYARTSTQLQENEKTIESQIAELEKYSQENGYEIVVRYIDDGFSGELLARPELDKLRDDASKGIFESVLIYDTSRLSRKYAHQAIVTEELGDLGIEVVFLDSPKIVTTEDKILNGFKGLFAEYEREKIKERTRRGKLHKARSGKLVGNEAPYGYTYIHKTKNNEARYEVNEEEAQIVRMIFGWIANDGCSLMEVRRRLHEKGIKARDSGKTIWQNSTLSRLLRRTDYIGKAFYNKTQSIVPHNPRNDGYKRMKKTGRVYKQKEEWIPIEVPAILDEDIFYRAQEQLKKNAFFSKRNQKYPYLLSGLIFCGCNTRMAGANQGRYRYYRCSDRVLKFPEKSSCKQRMVRADVIDPLVWQKVCEFLNNPELIAEQLANMSDQKIKEKERLKQQVLEIEKKIEKLSKEEERVLTAYRQEIITIDQLKDQIEKVKKEKKALEEEKEKILSQPAQEIIQVTPQMVERYCGLIRKRLPDFTSEEKQQLLRLLVDKIIVRDKTITIQGIIPADTTLQKENVSQSIIRSNDRSYQYPSDGGGGHIYAFPSILYKCRNSMPKFELYTYL